VPKFEYEILLKLDTYQVATNNVVGFVDLDYVGDLE